MFQRSLVRRFVLSWRRLAYLLAGLACGAAVSTSFGQTYVEMGRTTVGANDYLLIGLAPASPGGLPQEMIFSQAEGAALEFGGWLFSIGSREEEVEVVETLRDFRPEGVGGGMWTGFTDRVEEGNFVWINGDPVNYTNWAPGEPNNVGGDPGEDWTEIWNIAEGDAGDLDYITWNDHNVNQTNWAVVEMVGTPPPLVLQIDPNTGYGRFRSTFAATDVLSVTLNGYELLPDGTPFDVAAWNASNLSARGVDAIDPNGEGERWETLNASPDQLLEAYLFGGSEMNEGEFLVMGKVFPNGSGEASLTLNYTVNIDFADPERPDSVNAIYEDALVEYAAFDVSSPGDYNGDGLVNLADYTVWRDTRNSTTNLAADGNNSGTVEAGDYTFWRQQFGASGSGAGEGTDAAVPEPATCLLALIAATIALGVKRSR